MMIHATPFFFFLVKKFNRKDRGEELNCLKTNEQGEGKLT